MAITIIKNPQLYEPVYNPMEYVVETDNLAEPEFKYLIDIYVNGDPTKVFRWRNAPEPRSGNGYGIVYIYEVLESFLTSDLGDNTADSGTTNNPNTIIEYEVKFGEEYLVAGVLTQFPSLTTDILRYAWSGSWDYVDHVQLGYLNYIPTSITRKFLTNQPATVQTMRTNSGWIDFLQDATSDVGSILINTYKVDGTLLGQWKINNDFNVISAVGDRLVKFPSHPYTLNLIKNTNFITGVQPVINSDTFSYDIQLLDTIAAPVSEIKTFSIIEPCRFERWNVIFLNRQGVYDSFTFSLLSRDEDDIKKVFYKQNPDRLTSLGNYVYSLQDRQKVTFYTKSTKVRTLHSNWITEDENNWLEELVSSPDVYIEDSNNNLTAVTVKNTKWTQRKRVNDKLFNLTIDLEMYDNYRQRG